MSTHLMIHQPKSEKKIRHSLNNSLPAIETLLKKLTEKGLYFLQNQKIGNYLFNFYAPKHKIAIEIDGYAHEFSEIYNMDKAKKLYVKSLGITVLRFTDYQVLTDIEEIIRAVKQQMGNSSGYIYLV